jgi:lipopolysaccharide transport system ATP-binding protein
MATYYRDFWALKEISLEVRKGEAVGIIGRNGSGKSTLLQIIAGTLAPTSGVVEVNGRVAALLELGSGFNPEFTGRENVFLNATLQGLSTEEIEEKFAAIASFADIGDFIEEPVKTYSNGMVMRLAFAVQTAVEANVMIIDEALAVGDAPFRSKCFTRLRQMLDNGTTLLFVSHEISVVTHLCNRALYLRHGRNLGFGAATEISELYREECLQAAGNLREANPAPKAVDHNSEKGELPPNREFLADCWRQRKGTHVVEIINFWMERLDGSVRRDFNFDEALLASICVRARDAVDCEFSLGMTVMSVDGHELISGTDLNHEFRLRLRAGQMLIIRNRMRIPLKSGDYYMRMTLWGFTEGAKYVNNVINFNNAVLFDWVEFAGYFKINENLRHSIYGPVHLDSKMEISSTADL